MISFVILHYKNIKDTIECINSINKLDTKHKKSIIIVDNGTLTKSQITKLKKYTEDLVLLNENLGFANGNNAGCKYATKKYKPDFLCVINNDTVITQKDFIDRIFNIYDETNFDMLGPKILTDNGESVNPFPVYEDIDEINKKIIYFNKLIKIYKSVILRNLLKVYIYIKRIVKKPIHLVNGEESRYNVALHGCAIIFSKKYWKKYTDIFYSGTFLYHEEEFLNYRKNKDNLISYYASDLEIFHKEGSSLNECFKNQNYEKLIFKNKEIIKSLELLKKVMEEGKDI